MPHLRPSAGSNNIADNHGANGNALNPVVTVTRNSATQFSLNLNEGSSPDRVVWTLAGSALARVDQNGLVTIHNAPAGMLVLTARDPESGIGHTIVLRVG